MPEKRGPCTSSSTGPVKATTVNTPPFAKLQLKRMYIRVCMSSATMQHALIGSWRAYLIIDAAKAHHMGKSIAICSSVSGERDTPMPPKGSRHC
jgi:hypothetical protein